MFTGAAVVSLQGTLASKAPAVAGNVRARILVLTGADDPLVPAAQVIAFEQEMRAARVEDWQLISYGNTLHGFTIRPQTAQFCRARATIRARTGERGQRWDSCWPRPLLRKVPPNRNPFATLLLSHAVVPVQHN
jgi:dienelactone hydrolase